MAQWKRAGPITQRSEDRNLALLGFCVTCAVLFSHGLHLYNSQTRKYFSKKLKITASIRNQTHLPLVELDGRISFQLFLFNILKMFTPRRGIEPRSPA